MQAQHVTQMQFLSDKSVAKRYEISRQSVWRWTQEGKLPQPVKLTNGSTRWKLTDLEQWEAQREVQA
jgi:prophage regulatory protein